MAGCLQISGALASDFQDVSLMQRSFRLLAQPLLFRCVTFNTLFFHARVSEPCQTPEYLLRFHERLAFLTLEAIAPLVRSISTYSVSTGSRHSPSHVSCHDMHATLFTTVPRFPNLCEIRGKAIRFTLPMLTSLYAVPRLQRINLGMCHTDIDEPLDATPRSKLIELKYSHREFVMDTSNWWLPFISGETTREMSLYTSVEFVALLRYISRTLSTRMKALKTLELVLNPSPEVASSFEDAIMKCPSLTKLAFEDSFSVHESQWAPFAESITQLLETGILSNLREIKVTTAAFALPFIRTCSLRKLEILPSYMNKDSSESLLCEIKQHCPHIAYLAIQLLKFSVDVFIHILNLPSLEYLLTITKSDLTKKNLDDARVLSILQAHRSDY